MKQRETIVLRAAFCALAYNRIQILEPRKWSKFNPPPFRADDPAIFGVAWRNNTGVAVYGERERQVRFGIRGAPDIYGMLRGGRFFGLECKEPGKKRSIWQSWHHEFFGGLGMLIGVVHGYDETIQLLNQWGIKNVGQG